MALINNKLNIAFTLIELLVVIAIIGILSGLIIVGMNSSVRSANIAKLQVFSSSLRNSMLANLISELKFDEGSGSSAMDSWSGGNNGTLKENAYAGACDSTHCPQWQSSNCIYGKCLSFDGSNDYLDLGIASNLNLGTSNFSIESWFKASGTGFRTIYEKGSINSIYPRGWTYIRITNTHYLQFGIKNDGTADESNIIDSSFLLNDNNWHHVVTTRSGNTMKIYIDGIVRAQRTDAYLCNINNDLNPYIGSFWSTTDSIFYYYFNGSIDNVRVYNTAVPVSAIKQQYYLGANNLLQNSRITKDEYRNRLISFVKN